MKMNQVDVSLHTFQSPEYQGIVKQALEFLLTTPVHILPPKDQFVGVGVYLLYYRGQSKYYRKDAVANKSECDLPIYVGKAVPRGWRTARETSASESQELSHRLREHGRSIDQGRGLKRPDFRCRFVILA